MLTRKYAVCMSYKYVPKCMCECILYMHIQYTIYMNRYSQFTKLYLFESHTARTYYNVVIGMYTYIIRIHLGEV